MSTLRKTSGRWWILLCVLGVWGVLLVQSCDRDAKRKDAKSSVTEPDQGADDHADAPAGAKAKPAAATSTLPGEVKPGSVQPTSPGPKAPAVFFLAGLKGYLEPCGCSAEVLQGGIDRIVGYVDAARKLYPDTTMLDAGDMLFEFAKLEKKAVPQDKAKADVIVAAEKALHTQVTVPGELDFALGTDFYLTKMKQAGVEPIAANLSIAGKALPATKLIDVGDIKLGVVGAVNPELYKAVKNVSASDPKPAVEKAVQALRKQGATTIVLVMHGDLGATKSVLAKVAGIDFGIVGHAPRETDQVETVNGAHTLEAFDQGRYLGVLKLYQRTRGGAYTNAGAGSRTELEKVERLIKHKREQLERFPPSARQKSPPIVKRLQDDIDRFQKRAEQLRNGTVDVPAKGNAFIYRPIPMRPGLPIDEAMAQRRNAFNEHLQALQMQVEHKVPPVPKGQAFYIGSNQCANCHPTEHKFWETTKHSQAVATLQKRNKLFDQQCIGCHVVGYEKPGGSVIGKLHYKAQLGGRTIEKNLENVGCEDCHGPGSTHALHPVDKSGKPQNINATPDVTACRQCHVPEHSPKFKFDAYVKDITGPGHPMKSK